MTLEYGMEVYVGERIHLPVNMSSLLRNPANQVFKNHGFPFFFFFLKEGLHLLMKINQLPSIGSDAYVWSRTCRLGEQERFQAGHCTGKPEG